MIDYTMILTLVAPILLLAVCDRILRWVFARRDDQIADQPSAARREVIAPRPAAAPVEAEQPAADRRVA